jgi:hypothetical protein
MPTALLATYRDWGNKGSLALSRLARKEEDAQPRPKHDIGSLAALKMQGAVSAAGVVF